jgi:ligand-binding sensor domain-containing protein
MSQGGIKSILTKHNLQSFTARANFQCLLFDHNELMYLASSEGIILYNGVNEQFIDHSENAGMHVVTNMIEDMKGIIWVACEDGQIFRISNKELTKWMPLEGLPKSKISKLLIDSNNYLWISTKGEGVYVYDQQYLYHFGIEDGLGNLEINDMTYSEEKGVIVCSDPGIQILQYKNGVKQIHNVSSNCLNKKDIIQDLKSNQNKLYLNNLSKGIVEWDLVADSCKLIWNNKEDELTKAWSISDDYQILMTEKILHFKSKYSSEFIPVKCDFNLSEVETLVFDKHQTLWILHKSKGLFSIYLPITQFDIPGKTIQDIAMSSDGSNLLLCTENGLQIMRAADGVVISSYYNGENLTSIFKDKSPDIYWIGSYGQGVIRFNFKTKESKRFKKENGLPDNSILQITGSNRYIWITTLAGIIRFDHSDNTTVLANLKIYNHENGLPTNFIYQILPDPSDRIWIGTDGNGMYYLDKNAYCIEQVTKANSTYSIYNLEYNDNNLIYFNASRDGLGYYDIEKDTLAWIDSPLRNLEYDCLSLLDDSILIAGGNGFLMLTNSNQKMAIIMDEEFGLTEIIPSLNAIYNDPFENVWIGCKNNLIRVQPSIRSLLMRPQNSFSSIKVLNQFIHPGKDSLFAYNENQFTFEFNAIHYLATDHLDYRYMLEGYDKNWIYSKEGNESFSNLPPGKYRFRVQSSIDKHYDQSNEIQFSFIILKPFWRTWWFVTFSILLGLILVLYIIKRREAIQEREQAIRRKTSELEFEILKSQVNPHFLFNSFNSVISLIEDDKDKAIEFTEKLSDYFRNIVKYRDEHLIPIHEELAIMNNYLELLRLRHPNQIEFKLESIRQDSWMAPMTLQLLMENAIKHNEISLTNPLKITIFCNEEYLVFKNSILRKRGTVDSTGFGLESIRLRYQLLTDNEIRIEKTNEYFSVEIPLLFIQK